MSISPSLLEPPSQPVTSSAAAWIVELLGGSATTAICVIAVASLGLMMLTGRISLRRGFQVVFGCFLMLGASTVAAGLQQFGRDAGQGAAAPVPQVIEPEIKPRLLPPANYDPYAGASLRRR
jgi:type IV secretory pathway VirB2 component (pilin)